MRLTRRSLTTGSLATLAAGLATPHIARAAAPVVLGMVPSGDFAPAIIAKEKGFFAAQGLDATYTIIPLIGDIPAGLISGSMQIGVTAGPTLLQAVENGLDLVAVSGNSRFSPDIATVSLLTAKEGGLARPEDLRGKRVAVPGLNSVLDLLFRRWLIRHGMQPSDVTLVEVTFPAMGDLLRSHQVDAAIVKEPFVTRALASGAAMRLANYIPEVDPHGLNVFWIATRKWAEANRPAVAQFRAGLRQGMEFFRHDPEAKEIEQRVLHSTTTVIPAFDTEITAADLQFEEEIGRQFGLIQGDKIDAARLIVS